jgi:hypothetical protein
VLQGVEAQVGQVGRFIVAEDAKDSTHAFASGELARTSGL